MVENAKGLVDTKDFFNKVNQKTGEDYWYFAEQYFYTANQPHLEYYQTDSKLYYRWSNTNDNFIMPLSFLINGKEVRTNPTQEFQSIDIQKHSQIEIMDWKYYVLPKKNY